MEDLLSIQQQLVGAIEQLYSNFKKDGPERKTGDYIRRRLETLDQYWQEFQNNHFKLCGYSDKSHDYFVTDQFESTKERYGHIRSVIVNYQARDAKPTTSLLRPATPLGGASTPQPPARTSSPAARPDGVHEGENQVTFRAQGVNSRTDELLKKQASNFRALQRKVTSVNLDTELDKWELDDILKTLQSRWSVIDSLHLEIDSELEGKNKEYDSAFYQYEQLYEDIKRSINRKIRSMCHREKSTPQMELPTFSGSFQQWTSFKDLFTETIHTNASLSGAQKMQFLKGKLRGEAERLVQHLQISSDNYITCWEILNNRYNNRKLIFTSHINTLMNLPVSQQASLGHIKRIHDTSLESLNAIKNLGVDISTWDPLLVHILSQKLDADTYNEYVASLKQPRELPSLKEFLDFLETKFTALETSRKKQENPTAKPSAKYTYNFNHNSNNSDNRFNYKKPTYFSQSKVSSNRVNKPAYPVKTACYYCSNRGHGLYYCAKFLELPNHLKRKLIIDKNLCKNCLYDHEGKGCYSESRCRECNGNHNSILHDAFCNSSFTPKNAESKISKPEVGNTHVSVEGKDPEILLATAMVRVQARDGTYHNIRALLDQGSETTLISERVAHILGLPRKHCQGTITGIGEKESNCKGIIKIKCRSNQEDFSFETDAYIMNTLIKNLPSYSFPKPEWPALENLPLADPFFNVRRPVDLLLGVDVFSNLLLDGIYKAGPTLPLAQKTRLGWILSGYVKRSFKCNIIVHDINDISQFWQSEDISESSSMSLADQQVVDFYNKTTIRLADGKYQVRLPLKQEIENKLGQSKSKAIAQFKQLERKFNKNLNIAQEYKLFINEYKQLGHMIHSNNSESSDYYLPHHCVIRNESTTTKLRVVFNASSPSSTGLSLNDLMERGPNLQQDLQSLLIKWRQFRFGFTSDVEKMFRVVWLHPDDQKYQKIIWRDSFFDELSIFQLTTVTYGTKAAPFLAMMTLRRLAQDERQNYQDSSAPKVIESAFYMDDLVYGSHSVESAKRLIQDIVAILKSGGFNLRKWKANNQDIIPTSNNSNNDQLNYDFKNTESSKTLGLSWNPQQDQFTFTSKLDFKTKIPTKRILLSNISKLFDPLGWLSPISTKIKLLFQQVWQLQLKWDEPLPENIIKEWESMKIDLENISNFYMPRWLGITENNVIELHGFSDASTKCYACVVYCKVNTHGQTSVTMIAGKSRLVPVNNKLTLPKLELCGALLLIKLLSKIKSCLETYQINTYCWVDSMVVLGWINGVPERWKPFVANRVKQIVDVVPPSSWNYVKSEENPADSASRGLSASQLKDHELWFKGPTWLKTENLSHIQKTFITDQEVRKTKKVVASVTQNQQENIIKILLQKYSSLSKIARILAWIYRFISKKQVVNKYLTISEIKQANIKIIKQCQQEYFSEEIEALKKGKSVASKSKICMLNPILDQDQVLRVGGRLKHANINLDMKHPIIIPKGSRLSELIIDQCHELTFHGGAKLTSGIIRQKYWLVGGLKATKKRIYQCVKCRKHSPSQHYQIMGDLPRSRVNPSRPFYDTGLDYTGYVFVKANKGRGILTTKGYVAVFVCMVTKAIHLELVSDLTTSAFLAALRRMSARRGVPKNMYSDQGTTFIGANKVLQEEYQQILCTFENTEFIDEVTRMGIKWHFNAPSWPSAGGLWEASVKSLKYHMKRVIGEQRLTFEEYSTLLSQLEACINQRPLCAMTEDPDDLNCLTPSHFLTSGPHLAFFDTETDLRTRWHHTQKLFEDIWKKWRQEYLTQLSVRSKWRLPQENIKVNDIVLIQDSNLPAGRWPLGRVLELHPGSDGFVRVVTLKTKSGIMKRPIVKLSILPVNQEQSDENIKNPDDDVKQVYHVTKPIKRNNNYSFSKLVFTILLFIMTFISSSEGSFNVTPLQNQSLYFDKVTNMALIKDEWRLVVYYDMSPYWEGSLTASKYLDYLQNICDSKQDHSQCAAIMLQLRHGYEQLSHYNNVMMSKQTSRTRRGLINGVGNIANSLFGILDSNFAEKYEQDIELIKKNQDHLAVLWKNQTSVVEAEFNLLKRTEDIMNKQHKIINLRLNQVEQQLNAAKKENLENNDFILSAIVASNLLNHLKEMQNTLLDTMTNIYNGQLSLHLLTPDQLRQELNTISGKISKDLCVPFENISLPNIYHLLKIKARMSTNYLLFETKIPLVHRDSFEIHKIIAVPRLVNNSIMINIKPVSSYLAINLQKDALLPITESDLKTCLQQESGTLLCRSRSPVYSLKDDESLCEKDAASGRCRIYHEPCRSQWHELHQVNTYFYFYCQEQNVKVLCDDQVSSLQLFQAGLLTTNQGCLLKFKDFTVYTHKQEVSDLHIKADVTAPKLSPINYLFNISVPSNGTISAGDEDVSEHSRQLTHLQKQIEEIKQTVPLYDSVSSHDIHHYTATYVIVIVAAVGAGVWGARRFRRRRSARAAVEQVEQRAGRAAPPTPEVARRQPPSSSTAVIDNQCVCSESDKCVKKVSRHIGYINPGYSDPCKQVQDFKRVSCSNVPKQNKGTSPTFRSVYVIGDDRVKFNSL